MEPLMFERQASPQELERIRHEWRLRLSGFDLSDSLEHATNDVSEDVEWHSLDSYLIGELWVHIHLHDFAFGGDGEHRNLCLAVAERSIGRELLVAEVNAASVADPLVLDSDSDGGR